jgi:C4-dicarboxylate transporter, DctM subunit
MMIEPTLAVILCTPLLLGMLICGFPVFVSLGLTGLIGTFLIQGVDFGLNQLQPLPYSVISSYLYVAIPLFILMGSFAHNAGLTRAVYDVSHKWLSHLRGGLGMTTIAACGLFSACSGSSVATAATMGTVAIPEMERYGYDKRLACGVVAAGGTLGVMIPPSVLLVLYAGITGTSATDMLIAGIIPGILTMLLLMLGVFILSWLNPSLAPVPETVSWRERFISLKDIWQIISLFILVLGGIYIGWFTPTEAAAVGASGALILMVIQRKSLKDRLRVIIARSFIDALRTTTMAFMVVVGAAIYAFFLTVAEVPQMICTWAATAQISAIAVLIVFAAIYLILGMFLDSLSLMLITIPIMFPVVVGVYGMSPIWFGVVCTLLCEIGLITPPVGLNAYVLAGVVRDVTLVDIFRGCFPFVLIELFMVAVLFVFPILATWLPMTMR